MTTALQIHIEVLLTDPILLFDLGALRSRYLQCGTHEHLKS